MDNQNQQTQQKGKRLTKRQAFVLIIIGLSIDIIYRKLLNHDNIIANTIGTFSEIVIIYSTISLLTKKGLRWK